MLVLTKGGVFSPRATALRASNPAAIITLGLEVLVQEVMAAITTEPWPISAEAPLLPIATRRSTSSGEMA